MLIIILNIPFVFSKIPRILRCFFSLWRWQWLFTSYVQIWTFAVNAGKATLKSTKSGPSLQKKTFSEKAKFNVWNRTVCANIWWLGKATQEKGRVLIWCSGYNSVTFCVWWNKEIPIYASIMIKSRILL